MTELRILIVDDTIVYRTVLREVVGTIPGCLVAGTAAHGGLALEKLAQTPVDVVLLDVEMPVMDGIETLAAIRAKHPEIGVIMVSGVNQNAAGITIQALQKGALEFIPKPEGADAEVSRSTLREQLSRVIDAYRLSRIMRGSTPAGTAPPAKPLPAASPPAPVAPGPRPMRSMPPAKVEAVVIGVSTGGPNALTQLIPKLPGRLGVPVFIVQHMPPVFTASLAQTLARRSSLEVTEAADGEAVRANRVYLAPGGKHMVLRNPAESSEGAALTIGLNENPPEQNCRPSVNVLFRSAALHYGPRVISVVMTGMGADGKDGVRSMKAKGAYCLTQDEASCVVYGMPRAVVEAGLSDEAIPLDGLADRITSLVLAGKTGGGN